MKGRSKEQKVLVAMSGGVDSSVAAALLLERGYHVEGAFMKCWSAKGGIPCEWEKEREDALRVAHKLRIPFRTFDFEKEYRARVIDNFIKEYRSGRTPNPDVLCNKEIKFGLYFKKARELGFDYVATGHYARTDGKRLLRAKDIRKDQTYFLWTLTPEILAHVIFPVGDYLKSEVREMATKYGLANARKKDSYGVCFIGEFPLKEFLSRAIPKTPGPVFMLDGREVGMHDGLTFYTIGERVPIGGNGPFYVVKKDGERNALIVTNNAVERELYPEVVHANNVHWIHEAPSVLPLSIEAKTRHSPYFARAQLIRNEEHGEYDIHFPDGERAPTSGQSLVMYAGEEVLGGGIIES